MVCRQSRRSQRSRRCALNPGGQILRHATERRRQPPNADVIIGITARNKKWAMRDYGPPMSTTPRDRPWEGQPLAFPKNVSRGNHLVPVPPRRASGKSRARVHLLREWGRAKTKTLQAGLTLNPAV